MPVDVQRHICLFPSQSLKINLARLRFSLQFFLSLVYWLSFLDFPPMRDFSSLLYRNALRESHSRFCRLVQGKGKKYVKGGGGKCGIHFFPLLPPIPFQKFTLSTFSFITGSLFSSFTSRDYFGDSHSLLNSLSWHSENFVRIMWVKWVEISWI